MAENTISRDEVLNALVGAVAASQAATKQAAETAAAAAKQLAAAVASIDQIKADVKAGGKREIPGRKEADGSLRFQLGSQWWLIRPNGDVLKSEAPSA